MTRRLFLLSAVLFATSSVGVTLIACAQPGASPESAPSTPVPKQASLPFSWEEHDLRFTIFDVAAPTKQEEQGGGPLEGYRQYVIHFQFENLLHEDLEIPEGGAGLDHFKLKTDKGNTYEPRFVGGFPVFGRLRPRSVITSANYVFEIRTDETPVELWGYDDLAPGPVSEELQLVYIFALE